MKIILIFKNSLLLKKLYKNKIKISYIFLVNNIIFIRIFLIILKSFGKILLNCLKLIVTLFYKFLEYINSSYYFINLIFIRNKY